MNVGYPISNGKSSHANDHIEYEKQKQKKIERAKVLNQLDWI